MKPTWMDCTGDVVTGDTIRWTEAVFGGSYRNPRFLGDREITALVLKDSYGGEKQQHTFSVDVLESIGYDAPEHGKRTARKGRNIYRNGTVRLMWDDESLRSTVTDEKHLRGNLARADRAARKEENGYVCV